MKTSYKFMSVDNAIKELSKLKKNNKHVAVWVIDFDKEHEDKIMVSYTEGCNLIRKAKSIVHNDDEYIPHLELFSIVQKDINNVIRSGTMHDILLPSKIK